jgi:hypothetical protein
LFSTLPGASRPISDDRLTFATGFGAVSNGLGLIVPPGMKC